MLSRDYSTLEYQVRFLALIPKLAPGRLWQPLLLRVLEGRPSKGSKQSPEVCLWSLCRATLWDRLHSAESFQPAKLALQNQARSGPLALLSCQGEVQIHHQRVYGQKPDQRDSKPAEVEAIATSEQGSSEDVH